MACNCNHTNDCNTAVDCSCGVQVDIYQNGLMVDSVVFTMHDSGIPEYPIFYCFDDIAISPSPEIPCTITYSSVSNSWEIGYWDVDMNYQVPLARLNTNSSCPLSKCDWVSDCLALLLSYREGQYMPIYWTGQFQNGYHSFLFNSNISGVFVPYTIYYNTDTNQWTMMNMMTMQDYAFIDSSSNLDCPIGQWTDINTSETLDLFTQALGATGYEFKTTAIECGCCDEQIEVTMTVQTNTESTQTTYTAEIAKDEYGNILAINGKQYYYFEIDGELYYVLFNGTSWVIQTDCDQEYRITEEDDYRNTQNNNLRKLN